MNDVLFALFVFVCLTSAALGTLIFHAKLPAHHRHDDTQSVVRLIVGIFVVMTSLVLGLMINSAKSRFDGINRDIHAFATDLIVLDQQLQHYGPETNDTHRRLVSYVRRAAEGQWPSNPLSVSDLESERLLNDVGDNLRSWKPTDPAKLLSWDDIRRQFRKVHEQRWALVEQAEGSIPTPILILVVAWLILIFASFGFRAPQNAVVVTSLVVASALISGAIYLITDMDSPFVGTVHVSQAPLSRALAEMQR
jgi:hypothetical protein